MQTNARLRPGDLVEVKSPAEILDTLDKDGTSDGLPFMPEMVEFCGRRFSVSKRIVKTCYYGLGTGMRKFAADDVVLLDQVRCSGEAHDGCEKACAIFWRESWLRRVENTSVQTSQDQPGELELRARLKTLIDPDTYFCQASEILRATEPLSHWERFGKCISEVRAGNCGVLEMLHRIGVWVFWRARKILFGAYARGSQTHTPEGALNLQRGELVTVKKAEDISETLNEDGYNRGLLFTPAMGQSCGQEHLVERKLEKIIVDGTGKMRNLRNTVYLEGSMCGCAHVAFGGCPRGEFAYWRELWLRRNNGTGSAHCLRSSSDVV